MTVTLDEGKLRFEFDAGTRAQRWDGTDAYRRGLGQMAGTKAVDLCWWCGNGGGLLEVTNYLDKKPPPIEKLAREAGEKFRDTVAGMAWFCQRSISKRPAHEFVRRFIDPSLGEKLLLALWFEADVPVEAEEAGFLEGAISDFMRPWLVARVVVTNRKLFSSNRARLLGLESVTSLGR